MKKTFIFAYALIMIIATAVIAVSASNVIISPSNPANSDNLICSVLGSSDDFDFQWYKNGASFKTDYGSSSTISASETSSGDTWKCVVYTPFASKVGEATVGIDSTPSGAITITPASPHTADILTGSTSSTEDFDLHWFKNGNLFRIDYGSSSTISASETTKHDTWTLKVYTPLYSSFVGENSVEILNSAPVIDTLNTPTSINEGQSLDVSFSATDADNDALTYSIYRNDVLIKSGNSDSWQTTNSDSGTYTYKFVASDGETDTTATKTITVNDVSGPTGPTDGTGIAGKKYIKLYNLEMSVLNLPNGDYLKIRNTAHSIQNTELRVYSLGSDKTQAIDLDIGRNMVKLLPLESEVNDSLYLLKIEVISDEYDGSDYLLVEN